MKVNLREVLQEYLDAPVDSKKKSIAQEKVLKAYEYLVTKTLDRFTNIPYGVEKGDLEQFGRIALNNALTHYDPARAAAFKTYAISCIRKGISRCIHESSWSKSGAENEKAINKATADLEIILRRSPDDVELAEYMDISESRLYDMKGSCSRNRPLYLNQCSDANEDEQIHLEDVLPSDDEDLYEHMVKKEQATLLIEFAEELHGNLREAAMLMFNGYSVKEIGEILSVSSSRAGMIVATVRERILDSIRTSGKQDMFSEWMSINKPGVKHGRIRRRRQHPKVACMLV